MIALCDQKSRRTPTDRPVAVWLATPAPAAAPAAQEATSKKAAKKASKKAKKGKKKKH